MHTLRTRYSCWPTRRSIFLIPHFGGALTEDPSERVSIQSYRFVLGMLGGLLVTTCTLPLVDWFGDGSPVIGYQLTIVTLSIFGMILFVVCFLGTKERLRPPKQQHLSFLTGASDLMAE